jgi:hypothetical protein
LDFFSTSYNTASSAAPQNPESEDAGNEPRTVVTSALAVRFVIFGGFFITKIGSPDISKIINKARKISSKNGFCIKYLSFFPLPDDTEKKSLHSSLFVGF